MQPSDRRMLITWLLCLVGYSYTTFVGGNSLGPVESPFSSNGAYALVVEDASSIDRHEYSNGLRSTKIIEWCKENGIVYRVRDVDTNLSEPWKSAREWIVDEYDLPAMIGRSGNRIYEGPSPIGEEDLLATLQELHGGGN